MGFSLYCIIESAVLMMNAFAILNDRFLIPYGLSMDHNGKEANQS